jgi:hypothetical protein
MKVALVLLFFTTTISPSLFPQDDKATRQPDFGYLDVRREPAEWPTPERLVSQLRSSDDQVRLNALRLMGLTDKEAYHSIWSQTSPSTVVGQKLLKPDDIRLMYAALGPDSTQQAVIAVLDREGQMAYAALAAPTARGWKRVAVFDCWCKYDMGSAVDALGEFIQLHPAPEFNQTSPQHFELVFHASGGGTGVYGQNEVHFRVRSGRLVPVLSFVSRLERGCETKASCDHLEARWFYPSAVQDKPGGLLVTVEGDFNPTGTQRVDWEIRELQNRYLRSARCESYEWKEAAFRYMTVGKSTICPN